MENSYTGIPKIVKSALLISEGWLVGSAIFNIEDGKTPKDYDILVSDPVLFQKTNKHLQALSKSFNINSKGGLKFKFEEDLEIDIWVQQLENFIKTNPIRRLKIYCLDTRTIITT